ncbi:MAG: hypothetical protein A2008_10805 [Candidatus Wallbacteria bacterium GWC2_49_35]|uniref:Uncharacterized protein n=1 Tax=Candidatus Wallbacteria bacterium GWC2_49_35 TaxID=1817813 RepID=A0A1F7WV36_9BACT|nr:MAG: hypothetical protein A2008_10805 [Candidatus Wallbacteria bacterium GWC2_49_35]HBC73369.1 hypothetical protein [Candidatus Wallbacteria bacterium]
MPNLNGMGPNNDPNWVCRRPNGQDGNIGRGGRGNFCRFGSGMGAGRGAGFFRGYNPAAQQPVEARTDQTAEIEALKEKLASLEQAFSKMKDETGEY